MCATTRTKWRNVKWLNVVILCILLFLLQILLRELFPKKTIFIPFILRIISSFITAFNLQFLFTLRITFNFSIRSILKIKSYPSKPLSILILNGTLRMLPLIYY